MSATLRRILRPITFRSPDATDYDGSREAPSAPTPPPPPVEISTVAEATSPVPEPLASGGPSSTPAIVNPDEIGLTRVILEMRTRSLENDSGEKAAQYQSSARDQKTGAKLPKGSMVDRKVG